MHIWISPIFSLSFLLRIPFCISFLFKSHHTPLISSTPSIVSLVSPHLCICAWSPAQLLDSSLPRHFSILPTGLSHSHYTYPIFSFYLLPSPAFLIFCFLPLPNDLDENGAIAFQFFPLVTLAVNLVNLSLALFLNAPKFWMASYPPRPSLRSSFDTASPEQFFLL